MQERVIEWAILAHARHDEQLCQMVNSAVTTCHAEIEFNAPAAKIPRRQLSELRILFPALLRR